jgi:hypothetical protein
VGVGVVSGEGSEAIGYVQAFHGNPRPRGALVYVVDIDQSAGKTLRISALLKAERVDSGTLWATASGEAFEQIAYEKQQFYQTFDWKRLEMTILVPLEARKFQLGLTLNGRQRVLIKDIQVEPVQTR